MVLSCLLGILFLWIVLGLLVRWVRLKRSGDHLTTYIRFWMPLRQIRGLVLWPGELVKDKTLLQRAKSLDEAAQLSQEVGLYDEYAEDSGLC